MFLYMSVKKSSAKGIRNTRNTERFYNFVFYYYLFKTLS